MAETSTSIDEEYEKILERSRSQIQDGSLKKTALIDAVRYNTDDGLLALAIIDAGLDVNITDDSNRTALFYAAYNRSTNDGLFVAKKLIAADADVNIIDSGGETAIFFAVTNRNVEVVRALIGAGADVNTLNRRGKTALFYARTNDKGKIIKALIAAGADVNMTDNEGKTALFYAVKQSNNKSVVRVLIDAGADVNITEKEGKTALFYAVKQTMNERVVRALIAAGDIVNITDNEGKTALFYAVQQSKNESVVRALIDASADVNITDNEWKTAFFYAVQQSKNERVVRALIASGADVNMTDNEGKTALFYAVQPRNNESVVSSLIAAGADVNMTDNEGKTALFSAIENSPSFSSARYLLDHGADLYVKDYFSNSVLSLFAEDCIKSFIGSSRLLEGLKLFLEKGAQIQTIYEAILNVVFCRIIENTPMSISIANSFHKDRYIQPFREVLETLLEFAIDEGRKNILEEILMMLRNFDISMLPKILDLLVKLGVDPDSVDSEGNTALHYATRLPFYDVPKKTVIELCGQLKSFGLRMNGRKNHENESPLLFCLCGQFPKLEDVAKKESRVKVLEEVIRFLLKSGSSMREITHSEKSSFHLIFDIFSQCSTSFDDSFKSRLTTKELIQVMVRVLNLIPCKDKHDMVHKRDTDLDGVLHLWATMQLSSPEEYAETDEDGNLTFKEIMKMILECFSRCGVKVNDRNAKEETPLHLCATWGAAKHLLDAGARPNDVDALGRSPLLHAAKNEIFLKKTDCFYPDVSEEPKTFWKAALKKGLDPWMADNNGQSVLKILIGSNQYVLANALVEVAVEGGYLQSDTIASSLLTTVCEDTSTSAHWKSILVEMILKARNPIPLMNKAKGRDLPLHICCANIVQSDKSTDWRKLVFKEGKTSRIIRKTVVKTDVTEESVHWTISKLLLSYGADYSIPDETGKTCLDIAKDCPPLKDFLTKPIDNSEIPISIPWTSVSERYEQKLAKVARRQESEHVDSFWYHKEHLASGSFGLVFAGINEKDGREVAIKRIETLRIVRREDLREISNLKALADYEQVIRYLSYFEDDANHFSYVVLELMEGSLEECLDTITLEIEESVKHCKDVVIGLRFLHSLDILHRDLKPSNILYKTHPELRLKIADFGLSRRIDSSATTVYGTNAGTRCWIAPEVMISLQDHSKSSDIFACGLVLHYTLSVKRHPFAPADDPKKSLFEINHETEANIIANRIDGWDDSLDPEATHLVKIMLDSDGRKRPSAAELLCHPFFWTKQKKMDLLTAVGNQPELECPRARRTLPLTAVETDLETSFGTIVTYVDWNDPGYVHMPAIYTEMTRRRNYNTKSIVELVRFIRNALSHISESTRPTPIRKLLLKDFVFLEYFPNLVMEVYKAVTTHGWDQTKEEIEYAMKK